MRSFASDNNSGAHPEVMDALLRANTDHAVAYGDDPWTESALQKLREAFGPDADPYLVFGGTAANVLGVSSLVQSFHAILCSASSHLHMDECSSPETFTGCQVIPIKCENSQLTPESIRPYLTRVDDVHAAQPRVVSITQATEYGVVYSAVEVKALCDAAHESGLVVHMDGARLANAAARLGVGLGAATRDLGVDVVSFGGTKNGLMCGEAVIFFGNEPSRTARFMRKKMGQLASKMRFIAAQFDAYLSHDLWLRNARHANEMAAMFASAVGEIPGVRISRPVATNMVFARIDPRLSARLQQEFVFYEFNPEESRFVTSFDTTQEDIECFVEAARRIAAD